MAMTPEQFLHAFVIPNVEDFRQRDHQVRLAFTAALSISHAADHYLEYFRRRNPNRVKQFGFNGNGLLVEHLSSTSGGAFKDVRSIANVFKHLYADDSSKFGVHSTVASAGAIETMRLRNDSMISSVDGFRVDKSLDEIGFSQTVHFTKKDGTQHEFRPVMEAAFNVVEDLVIS